METYGKILLIAMPSFLVLVLFEKWYGWYKGNDTVRTMDMISSLSSGITNVTKDILGLSIAIIGYDWLVNKLAITVLPATWMMYVVAFFVLDFAGYWVHRIDHKINFFWNAHIVHHSSEEFNLACALRQSISSFIRVFTFLLIPAALVGVPPIIIATVAPIHLFAQFWYHTRHIGKLGWLEYILVTPSHHRVHHAINPEYLDKNLSQIFIFWDKLFGTFQEELDDVPPVYGITRPVQTWNPIKINFQHMWLLIKDAWHASNWMDKLRIWFMPTGWRPADVAEKYPVYKIEDVYHFDKYKTKDTRLLKTWSWLQILMVLLFISYLFGNIARVNSLNSWYIYLYGAFVFLSVYAFTELMDNNTNAWLWELLKNILGAAILINTKDWFGISIYSDWLIYVIAFYLLVSSMISFLFCKSFSAAKNHSYISS